MLVMMISRTLKRHPGQDSQHFVGEAKEVELSN
jgi:hypothetical protein